MNPIQSSQKEGRKLPRRDAGHEDEQDAPLLEDIPIIRPTVGPASTPGLDSGRVVKPVPPERDMPGVHVR